MNMEDVTPQRGGPRSVLNNNVNDGLSYMKRGSIVSSSPFSNGDNLSTFGEFLPAQGVQRSTNGQQPVKGQSQFRPIRVQSVLAPQQMADDSSVSQMEQSNKLMMPSLNANSGHF